jgi:hypothetical protein
VLNLAAVRAAAERAWFDKLTMSAHPEPVEGTMSAHPEPVEG